MVLPRPNIRDAAATPAKFYLASEGQVLVDGHPVQGPGTDRADATHLDLRSADRLQRPPGPADQWGKACPWRNPRGPEVPH